MDISDQDGAGPSGLHVPTANQAHFPNHQGMELDFQIPNSQDVEEGRAWTPDDPNSNWHVNICKRNRQRLAKGEQVVIAGQIYVPPTHLVKTVVKPKKQPASPAQPAMISTIPQKKKKLPPLPKTDYKVIIRPKKGMEVKKFMPAQFSKAIVAACNNPTSCDYSKFIVRPRTGSNIIIVSTPHEETADVIRRITSLFLEGKTYAVNVYLAAPEDVIRGVIHGVDPNSPSEELLANIRLRTQGVEIVQARMLGRSRTAVLTFMGPILPRYVIYYGGETACYPYRPTQQICQVCLKPGHRADVCPNPNVNVCRNCGLQEPEENHTCEPKCVACQGNHPTGDRVCKHRLRTDTKPNNNKADHKKHQQQKPLKQHISRKDEQIKTMDCRWFATEEEERLLTGKSGHKSRSRSRPMSTGRSNSRGSNGEARAVHSQQQTDQIDANQQGRPGCRVATPGHLGQGDKRVSWNQVAPPAALNGYGPCQDCARLEEQNKQLKNKLSEQQKRLTKVEQQLQHLLQAGKKQTTAATLPMVTPVVAPPVQNTVNTTTPPPQQASEIRTLQQTSSEPTSALSTKEILSQVQQIVNQMQQAITEELTQQLQAQRTATQAQFAAVQEEFNSKFQIITQGVRKRTGINDNPRLKAHRRSADMQDLSDCESVTSNADGHLP